MLAMFRRTNTGVKSHEDHFSGWGVRVGGGGECDVVAWCLFVFVCDGGSVSGSVCVRADSLPTKMAAVLLQSVELTTCLQ